MLLLKNILKKEEHFDFCMCNPPFFSNENEQKKVDWRNSNITNKELITEGGEVQFIKNLFDESVSLNK